MARELVLGRLKTQFIGLQSVDTGAARNLVLPASSRVLKGAWLGIAAITTRALYGMIMIRIGGPEDNTGIHLAEGWFGGHTSVAGDDATLHGEGIAWHGELPLFSDPREARILFYVRNDNGATSAYTGGYAWQEFEENDRPS